jgi:endonuclease YncB( thermonuclease family)
MRSTALWAIALGAAMMLASPISAGAAGEVRGKPQIIDGNTLEVAKQRFRLAGIVAPAPGQVCQRAGQEYECGKVARAMLWDLTGGGDVTCQPAEPAADATAKAVVAEKPAAVAAICKAGDTNLNEGMVSAGWAVADPAGTAPYDQLEKRAKAARRGLWTGEFERPRAGQDKAE